MDDLIKRFDSVRDNDLRICEHRGVAYQRDMSARSTTYGAEYFAKVAAYEGTDIASAVNAGRCALLARHLPIESSTVLDVGAGTGAFMRAANSWGFAAKGFDVIPQAADALRALGSYADDAYQFDAVTMWDVLEHLEHPQHWLKQPRKGALLFASIPVFRDLAAIRDSKHYRPGEHLYYWTEPGFIDWMALYGFRLLEQSDHETRAGRESIGAFAFCKDLPDYHDHLAAYQQLHSTRHYGSSASELHLDMIAHVVRTLKPMSIIDYGCGRSDLVAHFWRDGARKIARYDPAVPTYATMPDGPFDIAFVCDVMEHIPMGSVDRVLAEVKDKSDTAIFTISTKLARAKLPDGRNAHVTLLRASEWTRWIADVFGPVETLPSQWEHELLLVAGPRAHMAKTNVEWRCAQAS